MIIENKNNITPSGRVVLIINIQILNYIKYSLLIPLVFFCALIISIILVLIGIFIFGGTLEPLLKPLSYSFNLSNLFEVDKKDILVIYGWLSLIFYIIGSLIKILFRPKILLSLKRKLKIAILASLLLSLPIVLISFLLLSSESTITSIVLSLIISTIGIFVSFLAIISGFIIDKIINLLQSPLQGQ